MTSDLCKKTSACTYNRNGNHRNVGDYLLENMGILFLPSLVMVMDVWPLLQMYLFEIVFIGIVVTIVTFTVTALSLKALMAWQRKRKEARHDSPS